MAKKERKNRIKVEDLPRDMKVTEEEMKHISGGIMLRAFDDPIIAFEDPIVAFDDPIIAKPRGFGFEVPVF